ncbi:MAG TPA: 4-hydroxy-tetrahydrodipicolinate synthase [Kiritimatiellia bacterium]|nr:4-hydroxy-tetrahydrodipicolinate synthase [Kiritimatiellia bacterium]
MLEGTYTAIVTPFGGDGAVDFERFRELIRFQVAGGVSGIVPVGTTGESPTLTMGEHRRVIEVAIEEMRGKGKVIAGTGANSTAEALELTQHAKEAGADATLQVTPYYNKPNALGLVRHFSAVADLGLPVVLYNVPGRAGREIPIEVIAELAGHPQVVSVKEAGGSVDRVSKILDACEIEVLSGDDGLTFPMMALGAVGVISVASNLIPGAVSELVNHGLAGRWAEARALHFRYYRLFCDLFLDTNPVPVKAALAMMGRIEEVYRLPLCEMSEGLKAKLRATLVAAGVEGVS